MYYDEFDFLIELEKEAALEKVAQGRLRTLLRKIPLIGRLVKVPPPRPLTRTERLAARLGRFASHHPYLSLGIPAAGLGLGGLGGYLLGRRMGSTGLAAGQEPLTLEDLEFYYPEYFGES
jgi:hypothetical protein